MTNLDATTMTLGLEQVNHLLGRVITEKLSLVFFMKCNAMLFHQIDELLRRVSRQCTLAEIWIERQKVCRAAKTVREVTPPTATDPNLFAERLGMIQQKNRLAPLACNARTEEARRPSANNHRIPMTGH
jgi:hypothetical protein